MSTTGFGALYYTDCRPGQGLQGGAGFQFQAASGAPATEAMALVQRTALYEPPAGWMRERRPVADYPRSLAHTCADGLLVTAAGRYLGQEANGTREGNQFTHAVVTRAPADYGQIRPAQLWAAPCWAADPAPGTELDRLPAHPLPGPLDTETVRDRIRATPGSEPLLTALLSAVQRLVDPARRRTVALVTTDPERAACWIAAATLLLPQPAALQAGFKIFVADARYGQHDIIALHPDWAGPWLEDGSDGGLLLFDLDAGRAAPVEPTPAARFWVPRFLSRAGYDAYDVVDAVELADQFARARAGTAGGAGEPTAADRLAAAVVAAGERLTTPEQPTQLADWLLAAPDPVLRIARDPLLEAVLAARPRAAELRTLAAAAASRGWAGPAVAVRDALLPAELAEALAAPDGVAVLRGLLEPGPDDPVEPVPPPDPQTDGSARRDALESALRTARPDQVPALLTLAHRHGLHPRTQQYRDAAHAFARWWLEDPDPAVEFGRWPAPPEVLDWVRDELHERLAGPRPADAVRILRSGWWRPLHAEARDPADPLDQRVIAVAGEHLAPRARDDLINDVLFRAFATRPPDEHPSTLAWRVLFGGRTASPAEARSFLVALREHGSALSDPVVEAIGAVLVADPEPSEFVLWCAGELYALGRSLPPAAAELAVRDLQVSRLLDELRAAPPTDPPGLAAALLTGVPDAVLGIRAEELADALLQAPREIALDVLRGAAKPPFRLVRAVERRWPRPAARPDQAGCRAVAVTFLLARGPSTSPAQADEHRRLLRLLEDRVLAMSGPARAAVEACYQPPLGKPWQDWVSGVTSTRRRLRRRFESRSGGPGRRGS